MKTCAVEGCTKRSKSRELCSMHYARLRRNGAASAVTIVRHEGTPAERWAQKYVVDDSGCWLWTAAINNMGYGTFSAGNGKHCYAHRFGYEIHKGPIPAGLDLDHLCRVPRCVNPDHLEAVTRRENLLRGVGPIPANARKTHCIRGHLLVPDNLIKTTSGRYCKACHRDRQRNYYRDRVAAS